ncbi:MAG: hypothetical protein GY746_16055, partial [Gammaproteobacteria bacterium]|nr:hypothetical protein [Gammaproteobacteria bacterium]
MNFVAALKFLAVIFIVLFIQACAVSRTVTYDKVEIEAATTEIPGYALLDVGIVLFDPGIPESQEEQQKDLVFPEVRRAEARYIPYHLKGTLESTGYWGSVWVLPEESEAVDLLVWGRVDHSDGYKVAIRMGAWDAKGREWLNKTYKTTVPAKAYAKYRDTDQDPYQNIYNEIANDLLEIRNDMSVAELREIRKISELRYAADLVPTAFGNYLTQNSKGVYEIQRLPSANDPMTQRIEAVREREYMLVDTVNEYYAGLYYEMSVPYEDWRKMSREEALRYKELKRTARMRQLMGVAAILGAIAYEGSGGSNSAITNTAILGGFEGIRSGFGLSTEADMHEDSIRELGKSFDAEVEPLVVEVEGQTHRLTGSAEEKYREWRRLLHDIYATETGGVYDNPLP